MNEEEAQEEYYKSYFKAGIVSDQPLPAGFQTWADKMTQWKYIMTLGDGTTVDASLFIDHQGVFDNGKYTQYMLNRFSEL